MAYNDKMLTSCPVASTSLFWAAASLVVTWPCLTLGSDAEILRPRVPSHLIEEVRQSKNPFEATAENLDKGKAIFQGKAFCAT